MHGIAHGGHGVQGGQHLYAALALAQREGLADLQLMQGQHGAGAAGQAGEIGPELVVEEVLAQHGQGWRQGVHLDGRAALAAAHHAVGQQGDAQHVVEVGVAEQDVVNAGELVQSEVAHAGTGVDEHVVIEQKGGGAAALSDGTRATQDADLAFGGAGHATPPAVAKRANRRWVRRPSRAEEAWG